MRKMQVRITKDFHPPKRGGWEFPVEVIKKDDIIQVRKLPQGLYVYQVDYLNTKIPSEYIEENYQENLIL